MNTTEMALLSNNPAVNRWFQLKHPDVEIHEVVSDDFRNKEIIFILPTYKIANEYYEIQQMWTYYMSRMQDTHKLVTIGWTPFKKNQPNYLQIINPPEDWDSWLQGLNPIRGQFLEQPELVDENILDPIEKMLLSHGENTFQSLMIGIRRPLAKLEYKLQNEDILSLQYTKEYMAVKSFLTRLQVLWQQAYSFFSLMPNFPELQKYIHWEKSLQLLLSGSIRIDSSLSEAAGNFLNEVLTAVTELYNLDKKTV